MVRVIFRILRSLLEDSTEEKKRSESDMASGSFVRSDQGHESNISLSAPIGNDRKREGKIKGYEREKRARKTRKMMSVENM